MDWDNWDLFAENGDGRPVDARGFFELIQHMVEEHDLDFKVALDVIFDMLRPGNSENSHDVKGLWTGAMFALGFGEVCTNVKALWLNIMPWGIGFAMYMEKDFSFYALSKEAQHAFIESMCVVLRAGDMKAHCDENNHIVITHDDGSQATLTQEQIVKQFRLAIDEELGPDAPEDPKTKSNDPTRRWMP